MSYSWGAGVRSVGTEGWAPVRPAPVPVAEPERKKRPGDLHQLAAELAPMIDVWQRLLAQHIPDRGGRCVTCTKGGTGLPSLPWPCSIHSIADLARRRHESRQQRDSPLLDSPLLDSPLLDLPLRRTPA